MIIVKNYPNLPLVSGININVNIPPRIQTPLNQKNMFTLFFDFIQIFFLNNYVITL